MNGGEWRVERREWRAGSPPRPPPGGGSGRGTIAPPSTLYSLLHRVLLVPAPVFLDEQLDDFLRPEDPVGEDILPRQLLERVVAAEAEPPVRIVERHQERLDRLLPSHRAQREGRLGAPLRLRRVLHRLQEDPDRLLPPAAPGLDQELLEERRIERNLAARDVGLVLPVPPRERAGGIGALGRANEI